MNAILMKASAYLLFIALGYGLKTIQLFNPKDSHLLAKMSLYITLPAAIIASFNGFEFNPSLFLIVLFGFGASLVGVAGALMLTKRRSSHDQALYLLNMSGFNIGSFALPFMVNLYPPFALIYLAMFDIGNSLYCMGVNYALAERRVSKTSRFSLRGFLLNLLKTPPFMTYVIMLLLLMINIQLPQPIYEIASLAGQANIFIVMFMFGLLFNPRLKKSSLVDVVKILGSRYLLMGLLALVVWFVFPVPLLAKQVLIISLFVPMTSVTMTYCLRLGCDESVASFVSSIAIPLAVMMIALVYSIFTILT